VGKNPGHANIIEFVHTVHANDRQGEREISAEIMESVIKNPDTFSPCCGGKGPHGGSRFKFRKNVDGKQLEIVAELKGTKCWVITGYEK
jgi:hypothetical protein